MKIVVFLRAVFSEIMSEISPSAFFFVKKQVKKHDVPFKKTVTFCENFRFFEGGFFSEKTAAIKLQFSQNVTVFLQGTSCFFSCFLTKNRAKGKISCSISEKTARKITTIFTKRNGFFGGYIVFFSCSLTKNRVKGKISSSISEKTARKNTRIFTKRNGYFAGYIVFF